MFLTEPLNLSGRSSLTFKVSVFPVKPFPGLGMTESCLCLSVTLWGWSQQASSWDGVVFSKKRFQGNQGYFPASILSLPERVQHNIPNKCIERNMCPYPSQVELKRRLTTTPGWISHLCCLNSPLMRLQPEDLIHVLKRLCELEMLFK